MKLADLLLRLDDLYSRYLDVRLAALTGGNITRSARVEDRLVVTLAAEDALRGKMRTRAELRDELERCLCSETKVDTSATDTPFPNPEKAAAGPYEATVKLDLVPGKDVADAQVHAGLTTPIEEKRESFNRGPWATELAEQDRRHEELLAVARELASIDPMNALLDKPGLLPASELTLARFKHALAQAARETAGSRTACANRWLSIAATLGLDPGKNPPDVDPSNSNGIDALICISPPLERRFAGLSVAGQDDARDLAWFRKLWSQGLSLPRPGSDITGLRITKWEALLE